ncbi:uncharacterized protein RCC_12026 [Ramularia collo-cygni]|uniref:Uncharacterized protein n=1 Tax=Ramularia collo-cygni TaxID=112498 RepID=A0A2D3URE3_9PEZI|nr:uncharacterized protein RCC_12026 [Ramularia collo-cygni]CZT14980.1 uncharacterized protein RCC_12026 [Ramularia collo-cygni]
MWQPYTEEIQRLQQTAEDAIEKFHSTAQTTSLALLITSLLITLLLSLITLSLFMLLITTNPDLSYERKFYITPLMRGITRVVFFGWQIFALGGLTAVAVGCCWFLDLGWVFGGVMVVVLGGCYGVYWSDLGPVPPPHGGDVKRGA